MEYSYAGRYEEAHELRKRQLTGLRGVKEPDHPDLLFFEMDFAQARIKAGRYAEGMAELKRLLPKMKANPQVHRRHWLQGEGTLAQSYMHLSDFEEAATRYEEILRNRDELLTDRESADTYFWLSLTGCYRELGRHKEAIANARDYASKCLRVFGSKDHRTILAEYSLAASLVAAGLHTEAIPVLEAVLEQVGLESMAPSRFNVMGRLADSYRSAGRPDDHTRLLKERRTLASLQLEADYQKALEQAAVDPTVLIPPDSSWHWYRPEDGSDPSEKDLKFFTTFYKPAYDDSKWQAGTDSIIGGFGYEDFSGQWTDEVDLHRHESGDGHHLAFFRHRFTTTERVEHLELHLQHDDGVVIFLDGKEVARKNVRSGPLNADLQARECRNHALELEVTSLALPTPLDPGEHVLAISLHNHDCWNDDLRLAGVRLVGWNGEQQENTEGVARQRLLAELFDKSSVKNVLIAANSKWRWLHPVDGVDPAKGTPGFHQSFFGMDFDDTAWATGQDSGGPGGGFGYGDERPHLVEIGTPREKPLGKSAYFRHRFTTTEEHTNLNLRCQRDDGIIVYLDGREIARDNMSEGDEAYELPARTVVGKDSETMRHRIPLEGITLPPGKHILAISLHNHSTPSSDLRIGGITLVEIEESAEN